MVRRQRRRRRRQRRGDDRARDRRRGAQRRRAATCAPTPASSASASSLAWFVSGGGLCAERRIPRRLHSVESGPVSASFPILTVLVLRRWRGRPASCSPGTSAARAGQARRLVWRRSSPARSACGCSPPSTAAKPGSSSCPSTSGSSTGASRGTSASTASRCCSSCSPASCSRWRSSTSDPHHDAKPYFAWMLLLEAGLLGSFLSLDLFVFFIFFEIVLVPMYFLIGGWGYGDRVYAATKFFLFTMFGSAFMLVGIIATVLLGRRYGVGEITFDLVTLAEQADVPDDHGALAVLRLRHRLRHQGAGVPVPHLAPRRPHPGAHRRLGDPRRRDAEARHLRAAALRPLPLPGGRLLGPPAAAHPRRHRHHLRGDRGDDADATSNASSPTRRSPTSASSSSARSP